MDAYLTISKPALAEYTDRGSRFLAYSYPVTSKEEARIHINALKKEHPKAVHHCFAYRLGFTGDDFRVSDDGEPSGSAGRPILGQIDSRQLTNVMVVVVRYFGGTLLGVPGLINAYRSATGAALEAGEVVSKPILLNYQLEFDYTVMNEVMRVVKSLDCIVMKQELQLFCNMLIGVPKIRGEEFRERLSKLPAVKISTL